MKNVSLLTVALLLTVSLHVHAASKNVSDPNIVDVQRAALAYHGMDVKEASRWKKKARLQALLPRFEVDYGRRVLNDVNVDVNENVYVGSSGVTVGPNDNTYSQKANSDQNFGIKAVWYLNELIFNPDQLEISREARSLSIERQTLLSELNKHYFERVRLRGVIGQLKRGKIVPISEDAKTAKLYDEKDRADINIEHLRYLAQVKFDEETAALDALTGGWFSQQLNKS